MDGDIRGDPSLASVLLHTPHRGEKEITQGGKFLLRQAAQRRLQILMGHASISQVPSTSWYQHNT